MIMIRPTFPFGAYFLIVGPTLLIGLLMLASFLEPTATPTTTGFGISVAHATQEPAKGSSDEFFFDRVRSLPIK
jgi:hypothetical protein